MIRTGDEYRESITDGRQVFVNGECVDDWTVLALLCDVASAGHGRACLKVR